MQHTRKTLVVWGMTVLSPGLLLAQSGFAPQAGEYSLAGTLPGDQTNPHLSVKTSGGWLVWQDNITDGNGLGISARRLDSSLSGSLGVTRVNEAAANDQEKPKVSLLNNGGAAFVWQGGARGSQQIYARFLTSSNTWATGDVLVNSFTNSQHLDADVATLTDGNVAVTWSSFDQDGSFQGVYLQRLSQSGQKLGGEIPVNQFTAFNQRTPVVAALNSGNFVVVWVSEQQRFELSVDIYARLFNASGVPLGNEFRINTGTNVCANPSVAASADGGFIVAWGEKDVVVANNSWDVYARPFSSSGAGGTLRRVNTFTYGDQFAPRISSRGSDFLMVWNSLGQDGSQEGVFGQFLSGNGSLVGPEFRVNTTVVSKQTQPVAASDGADRFLVAWAGFAGGVNSFDLFGQRYASAVEPLLPPSPPFLTALSSTRLSVAWPELSGYNVASYELYVNGSATPVVVTSNLWTLTNLAPSSSHTVRLAYVLGDGRRSPLSGTSTGTTWGGDENFDGLPDDWQALYWGSNPAAWPSPNLDSDGDGVSNLREFLAGTNPLDANSVLRTRTETTAQGVFLHWNTETGLMYQVQTSPDLASWENLGTPRFASGATDSIYVGGGNVGYFRILRLR